jgi:Lipocalin-like domain
VQFFFRHSAKNNDEIHAGDPGYVPGTDCIQLHCGQAPCSIAYYGTYSVSGTGLILHVEGSTFPNWTGTNQKRTNVTIKRDKLTQILLPQSVGPPLRWFGGKRNSPPPTGRAPGD